MKAGGMHAVCGVAGCMLLFLRPLLCVFTHTELALLLAGAYGYDQWQVLVGERDAGSDARSRKRPLTVVSVTREGKMTLLQGDLKRDDWRKNEGDADSVGTVSTVDDSDVSLRSLSARSAMDDDKSPHQFDDDDASDRLSVGSSSVVHADGRALFVTSSICMSRHSIDQLRDIVFDHARGHLELRQDAMYVRDPTTTAVIDAATHVLACVLQVPPDPALDRVLGAPVRALGPPPRAPQEEQGPLPAPAARRLHRRDRAPPAQDGLQGGSVEIRVSVAP